MGSDVGYHQPNGCHLNGLLPNKAGSRTRVLDMERWMRAEERTAELIACIQPDQHSWESRKAVASYFQRLIMQCIPCEVFIYGSVPLKTYLPDGDIDLTVFSEDQNLNGNFAAEVRDMLEVEQKNEYAEYCIKEVRLINAEVKVVKCLVDNIVVDISFSQLGGLCTLCFLEQVDQHIKQNHLFKRSIILIKAWCYYESRLLGAYYGLLSTYALETLILYIFNVFNSSFAGPLEVLYRFLEFFSNFDWDNFCISLQGPVPIRSLPDMTADPPRKDGGALLLSRTFLDTCSFYYSVVPSTPEIKDQFLPKYFNVIDFIRTNNNLGRSVNRGNFFRIRSAFAFGAQTLNRLLHCPKENIVTELNQFFMNTWDTNRKLLRPDTDIVQAYYGFVNRYQMEDGEEVDEPGFFCSEYMERKQIPASVGGGKEFPYSSFTNSFNERGGQFEGWTAYTMDHNPDIDYTQCQSRANVFSQSSHQVSGGKSYIPFTKSDTAIRYNRQFEGKVPINLCVGQSGSSLDTPGSVHWANNSCKSKERTSDILSGDMASHLSNMLYARSCQTSSFDGPHFYCPSIVPSQQQFMPGNRGKPSSPAVNYTVLPETAVMLRSRHHSNETTLAGGYQHYPKRTHMPNPRSGRDFQSSSPRYQKGNRRYPKKEPWYPNSNVNSGPRFSGRPHQWENPNSIHDYSAARNDRAHMQPQWKALGKQPSLPDQPSLRRAKGSMII